MAPIVFQNVLMPNPTGGPDILTSVLPAGVQGTFYTFVMTGSGGTLPYVWSLAAGTLDSGITLSAGGVISGTPLNAETDNITIRITDAHGLFTTKAFSLTFTPAVNPLTITTTSPLPTGTEFNAYTTSLVATGGNPSYTWSIISGAFQTGIILSSSGVVSGTPTQSGTDTVTIQVQDSNLVTTSKIFNLTITAPAPLTITTTSPLPSGNNGIFYSTTLNATGGIAPYIWSILSGSLQTGLTLSSGGTISGTPSVTAINTVTIQVQDNIGTTASKTFSLTINASVTLYQLPLNRTTTWAPGLSYCPVAPSQFVPTLSPFGPNGTQPWNGGIPTNYTQFGPTLTPSGGSDTAQINTAIANAGAVANAGLLQPFVQLGAGQFIIDGNGLQMKHSYVELRGVGPGSGMKGALAALPSAIGATLLVKSDGLTNPAPVISIGNRASGGGAVGLNTMLTVTGFTADCVAGTNSGTVGSTAGLAVGQIVYINEAYDASGALTWYNLNGNQGGTSNGFNGWGENASAPGTTATSRPIGQAMEIASLPNNPTNLVIFTTVFHQTYRFSQGCHLGVPNLGGQSQVNWTGVRDLFVTGGDGGDGGGNIVINGGAYCWVKHIESSGHGPKFGGALVHLYSCFRCEVRDSYLHSNAANIPNISPGGGFYNIVVDAYAADNLIENNISWIGNKVLVMRSTGGGNVIGYNYMDDGYGNTYMNQMETALNSDHMTTSHHELFEGNYGWQLGTDSRWGNSLYTTWFRNWASSFRISAWPALVSASSCAAGNPLLNLSSAGVFYEDGFNRNPGKVGSHHWFYNYVGNVLGVSGNMLLSAPRSGTPAQTTWNYEWYPPSSPAGQPQNIIPIWEFGFKDGSEPNFPNNGLDPSVLPTVLRDANYDYWSNLSHWHGIAGVATNFTTGAGATTPPGASASGGIILPNSLYITGAAPGFFHGATWPWVDGSSVVSPLPGNLPAQTRFNIGTPNTV